MYKVPKQTGTPVFTPGKTTVNGKEVTVKSDETVKLTFDDGTTEKKVPEKELTLSMKNGVVTFTQNHITGKV